MPERARVTSLEAIESFRAKLIIYREKAGRLLDEVHDEVTRARLWLQSDRRTYWQSQVERRARQLQERQQELFSAKLSTLQDASPLQQAAVQKARQALRDAESHLQLVQQWNRQFGERVEPLAHRVEKLQHILAHDLPLAVAWLDGALKTLSAYAEVSLPGASTPAPPAESRQSDTTKPDTEAA